MDRHWTLLGITLTECKRYSAAAEKFKNENALPARVWKATKRANKIKKRTRETKAYLDETGGYT